MRRPGRPPELIRPRPTTVVFEEKEFVLFKEAATRQGKTISELVREWAKAYIEKHQQNDQPALDNWQSHPDFVAFPTLGEAPQPEIIKKMDDKMLKRLIATARNYVYMGEKETQLRGLV